MKFVLSVGLVVAVSIALTGCAQPADPTGNVTVTLTITGTVKEVHVDSFWNPTSTIPHPKDLNESVKLPFSVTYTARQGSIVSLLACDMTHALSGKLHLTISEQGQQPNTNHGYDPCPTPLTVTADII
jgi:hypothetical protein